MARKPSLIKKIIRLGLYLLVVFFFQEAVFRYLFPLPEIENLDRIHYANMKGGEDKRVHVRDQDWYWESSPDTATAFLHEMNRYGFRGEEWEQHKPKDKKRLIFIGDSFVEGVMANQEATIPEGFLSAGGEKKYQVWNAGMLGTGLSAYLQLVADIAPLYKPDVLVFCIYANDLGKKEPAVPSHFLEPQFYNAYKPRLLEIIHQMGNRGPIRLRWNNSPRPFLPAVPEAGNPWTGNEEQLAEEVSPDLARQMKAGTYNPYRVNALAKEAEHLKASPRLGETIPFLKYTCEQSGVKPLVVYIPSRNQVTDYYLPFERESCMHLCNDSISLNTPAYRLHQQVIAQQCNDFNIPFLDMTAAIELREGKGDHLYWNYDEHMRGEGYLLLGEMIWEKLEKN